VESQAPQFAAATRRGLIEMDSSAVYGCRSEVINDISPTFMKWHPMPGQIPFSIRALRRGCGFTSDSVVADLFAEPIGWPELGRLDFQRLRHLVQELQDEALGQH
jgi:hypothetical protein